ncbi:VOC family protein [Actinopolymorpha sp. B11F2]|uniref:VOC family protein n=1 Tax=Actinopolymorpha sp. B11F2 TaxID=3160862 RepID=UPI0032E4C390
MTNKPIVTAIQSNLSTNNIDRLKSFYGELFGAEEYMRVPGGRGEPFYVCVRFGAADLGIVKAKSGADAAPGRVILAVFVESVDDLLPRVEPAGGTVLGPAKNMPWGHRVAHITDPDGNPVNLTQQL